MGQRALGFHFEIGGVRRDKQAVAVQLQRKNALARRVPGKDEVVVFADSNLHNQVSGAIVLQNVSLTGVTQWDVF